jgi:hypothetical protein
MTGGTHMRRTACGLAAVALGALAAAAPASADNEVTDACGIENASLPGLVSRDHTVPWLDLCGADVRGVAGSGPLRALHVTLRLAGDTANRAGSAAYDFVFTMGTCSGALTLQDLGPSTSATQYSVSGHCDAKTAPCDPPIPPGSSCTSGGVKFTRVLPATGAKISGSTVTFDFDPNALPVPATPKAFLDGFRAGQSLSSLGGFTLARAQYGPTEEYNAQLLVDDMENDKPFALGGARRSRR